MELETFIQSSYRRSDTDCVVPNHVPILETEKMKEFYSLDVFKINPKSPTYIIELEPSEKVQVGEEILLNGERRIVTGMNMFAHQKSEAFPKTRTIGLHVKEVA